MVIRDSSVYLVGLMVCMASNTGCQSRGTDSRSLLGAVEIRDEQIKDTRPADLPGTVYVSDFTLEAQRIEGDHGILPERRLGPIGQRLPNPLSPADPEARAREIVDTMSRSLVKRLRDKGFAARRLSGPQATMPRDGWLLQGIFTEVDEGNRIKRAVIGFGRGATRMNVQVGVSDLTSAEPQTPFIVFGTIKDPQKTPGAVATVNPYVAAAKFVMEKNATQKDIEATAGQIVDEILNYTHKFREQTGTNKPAE